MNGTFRQPITRTRSCYGLRYGFVLLVKTFTTLGKNDKGMKREGRDKGQLRYEARLSYFQQYDHMSFVLTPSLSDRKPY